MGNVFRRFAGQKGLRQRPGIRDDTAFPLPPEEAPCPRSLPPPGKAHLSRRGKLRPPQGTIQCQWSRRTPGASASWAAAPFDRQQV